MIPSYPSLSPNPPATKTNAHFPTSLSPTRSMARHCSEWASSRSPCGTDGVQPSNGFTLFVASCSNRFAVCVYVTRSRRASSSTSASRMLRSRPCIVVPFSRLCLTEDQSLNRCFWSSRSRSAAASFNSSKARPRPAPARMEGLPWLPLTPAPICAFILFCALCLVLCAVSDSAVSFVGVH